MGRLQEFCETVAMAGEEDDYMGDLSQFLTPEASSPPRPSSKKVGFLNFLFVSRENLS